MPSAALWVCNRESCRSACSAGTSFSRLLQETRLEIAKQNLLRDKTSITDLALNLGYADVSVFSRHFKQWTGLSRETGGPSNNPALNSDSRLPGSYAAVFGNLPRATRVWLKFTG